MIAMLKQMWNTPGERFLFRMILVAFMAWAVGIVAFLCVVIGWVLKHVVFV